MTADEFERRLRALAKRDGMTFGSFATLGAADRAVLTATIVARIDPAAVMTELEVNALLKDWLAGAGAMVETDHVHIRRWLVDTQVLSRTSDCREYRLHPDAGARTGLSADARARDAAAIVAGTRRDASVARERRKAEWMRRSESTLDGKP